MADQPPLSDRVNAIVLSCFKSINSDNPFVGRFNSGTVLSSVNINPGALPNVLGCIDKALKAAGLPVTGLVPHALDSLKTIGAVQQKVLDAVRTALAKEAVSHLSNLRAAASSATVHLDALHAAAEEATSHLTSLHEVLGTISPQRRASKKSPKKKLND